MAEKRMFSKAVIDSDRFLEMPLSSQLLYFHLGLRADDDGFVNNPKRISRMIGCGDDDLTMLAIKNFIIPFKSGVIVIVHWLVNNYIRKDRYKPTVNQNEFSLLKLKENDEYQLITCNDGMPMVNQMTTIEQPRLDKDSIVENKLVKNSIGEYRLVKDSISEMVNHESMNSNEVIPFGMDDYQPNFSNLMEEFDYEFNGITVKDEFEIKRMINQYGETYVKCGLDDMICKGIKDLSYLEKTLRSWKKKELTPEQVYQGER
ncbi:MAG: replisome organizer [Firmicutes bacterium]|nr:replisome organizer [Bacillota bacterium]